MKVFNLRCTQGHAFEGWFGSADDFESQCARGLLNCPLCGSADVAKAPAAPYIGGNAAEPPAAVPAQRQVAVMPTPAQMQAVALKLARELASNTEDVGAAFAEEARRIHYKEAPARGIRGVATRDEAKALEDEGIPVMPLPFGHLFKDKPQ